MRKVVFACLVLLSCWLVVGRSAVVVAQTASAATEVSPETSPETVPSELPNPAVFDKPSLQSEIDQRKATYRVSVENYLAAERTFVIAKQQYKQLNTLASLEAAVKASREVLVARDETLTKYLEVLQLELVEAGGIDVKVKEAAANELDESLVALAAHQSTAQSIEDRQDVASVVATFVPLAPVVENVSYKVMTLLNVGQLRVVYDKATALHSDLQATTAEASNPLKQAERDRAFSETARVIGLTGNALAVVDEKVAAKPDGFNSSSYNQLNRLLNPIFSQLSQVLSYLNELSIGM